MISHQAAGRAQIVAPAGPRDRAGTEEQAGLYEHRVHGVEDGRGDSEPRRERQPHHQIGHLPHDVKRQQPADVHLRDRGEHADEHRRRGEQREERRQSRNDRRARSDAEHDHEDAEARVERDLRQQSGERRGDADRRRVVRGRQPEEEREQRPP